MRSMEFSPVRSAGPSGFSRRSHGAGGGNCHVNSLGPDATTPDTLRPFFPSVPDDQWEVKIVPDTGHGINYRERGYLAPQTEDRAVADDTRYYGVRHVPGYSRLGEAQR